MAFANVCESLCTHTEIHRHIYIYECLSTGSPSCKSPLHSVFTQFRDQHFCYIKIVCAMHIILKNYELPQMPEVKLPSCSDCLELWHNDSYHAWGPSHKGVDVQITEAPSSFMKPLIFFKVKVLSETFPQSPFFLIALCLQQNGAKCEKIL